MPRAYEQDSGYDGPVVLTAVLTCEDCGEDFEATWVDDSVDFQQMVEPPVSEFTCPLGHVHEYSYPGYWNYGDAG